MKTGKRAGILAVYVFGMLGVWSGAIADGTPRLPSLDDYPPAVVRHVLAEFDLQRQALEARGIPANEKELADWNACANSDENAHSTYVDAFATEVLSARLKLLAEAATLPCYQYPIESGFLSWLFESPVDVAPGMREASSLIASEVSVQLALGEFDRAVQHAETGIGLIGQFSKAPTSVVQLSRHACTELILGAVQDLLSCATLTEVQLARLDQALARAYDPTVLARTWIAEKIMHEQTDPFETCATIHLHDARSRAQLLAVRAAVAIERYVLSKGALPNKLADLVPAYLSEIPLDPFNGEPLTLAVSDEAYAVLSVDDDGIACPNPLEVARRDERSMVRISVEKSPRPLSELYYEVSFDDGGWGSQPGSGEIKSIELVSRQLAPGPNRPGFRASTFMFAAGPIDGGMAVILDSVGAFDDPREWKPILAAFWVSGGTVYTINTWAKDLAPHLQEAPEAITFDRVRDVVH